ncbi:hypothetical protein I3843_05G130900 [Carya illinoinensis]|uniref:glutathione transferase n=1 Tax=Carya illinoinensis TaxID=32201 RepID=A0A8T1QIZ5_CARIL|nr:glutathione S-transferase U17-like [Carya illinoinensis]KAG2707323.1 hypothetical protein I3760_05G143500 [Carya illinoinensis]KAG6654385.1 hypothetical protein CIPAW_05G142100 [Carya illinoinensis]KAG6713174.1 hypothetical protein I3842_05G139000 [Carya illinoinensis]KAG7979427.1 hypothetical protein I3843_05G130900 [Carya illinoinensis]
MGKNDIKLIGSWASAFTTRVRIAFNIKNVEYEHLEEKLGKKSDLLLQSNPVHKKFPVLLHDGKPLPESLIIVQYIDEVWSSGPSILPADPMDRALARFWAAYVDEKFFPSLKLVRVTQGEQLAAAVEAVGKSFEVMDGAFHQCSKGNAFFGGERVGYLDIAFGCTLAWLRALEKIVGVKLFDEVKHPALAKWMDSFCSDPAVDGLIPETDRFIEFLKLLPGAPPRH